MSRAAHEESRPAGNGTAIENTGKRSNDSVPPVDLISLTPRERQVWDAAYLSAWALAHEAGAKWADDRAATLHATAVRVVHQLAGLPEIDPEEARQAALRREQRWSA